MPNASIVWILGLVAGAFMTNASTGGEPPPPAKASVNASMVARLPYPGTVAPSALAFTVDGSAVTYLKPEGQMLDRVLWKATLDGAPPRVIARPPGPGNVEGKLSAEEALRRERQRLTATGISQIVRAEHAELAVVPLNGDLYWLEYAPESVPSLYRLTDAPSPEIDPQFSPDMTRIAFVRDGDLFGLELKKVKETQLTTGATDGLTHGLAEFIAQEELDRSSGFWWSPDGRWIAYQETDERAIPPYTITHQGGDEFSVETHRYPFSGAKNAAVRLGVIPAEGGETTWLAWHEPDEDVYLARVDWESPETLLIQVLSRDQKTLRLLRVDRETGKRTTLIEETSPTWVELHDDLRVVEGTGEILWSSERTGFRHLELLDRDGKLIRPLTAGDWAIDPVSHGGGRGVVALDSTRREVWFMAGKESPLESHLYRVSLDGGPIEKLTDASGTHRAVVSPDFNHFALDSSSLSQPPISTIRDRSGRIVTTFANAADDPRLATTDLVTPQLLQFKTADGVTLHGAFYPPPHPDPSKPAPLIVMVYGGPTVQLVTNSWGVTADLTAQFLHARGFAVWKLDNRGSSRRGRAFQQGIYHRLGSIEVEDQAAGVRWLTEHHPEIDPNRVGITGGSYGGYMTLRCMQRRPEIFRAGVSVAPVTFWEGYDTAYTERYMGTPAENPEGYRESSVLNAMDQFTGDLMLIHGMLDENVHFRHTARLVTAFLQAAKPFRLLPLPDERHSSRRPADRQYVAESMVRFFENSWKTNESPRAGN
jgi:dipeptidyl-peptidase-4